MRDRYPRDDPQPALDPRRKAPLGPYASRAERLSPGDDEATPGSAVRPGVGPYCGCCAVDRLLGHELGESPAARAVRTSARDEVETVDVIFSSVYEVMDRLLP